MSVKPEDAQYNPFAVYAVPADLVQWLGTSVSDGLKHRSVGTEGFEPSLEAV